MKLRFSNKISVLTFLFLIFVIPVCAQTVKKVPNEDKLINFENENQKLKIYQEWQEVRLKEFSFLMPRTFTEIERGKCYESGCYNYGDQKISLDIDISDVPSQPSYSEMHYSDFKYCVYNISGGKAWKWTFKDRTDSKYEAGVLYYLNSMKNERIGIYLRSNNIKVYEIAEKVFQSVEFKK